MRKESDMRRTLLVTMLLAAPCPALPAQAARPTSPVAGQEHRTIKAISDEELQELREGEGIGLAAAAELNHYPGPRHVLDLADSLRLSAGQRTEVQSIYATMHAAVLPIGGALIAVEARMDSVFAARRMDSTTLERLVSESAQVRGQLRLAHLRAHLATLRVLTPSQVAAYDRIRGYMDSTAGHMHHPHG
jgi:hypothetical protein